MLSNPLTMSSVSATLIVSRGIFCSPLLRSLCWYAMFLGDQWKMSSLSGAGRLVDFPWRTLRWCERSWSLTRELQTLGPATTIPKVKCSLMKQEFDIVGVSHHNGSQSSSTGLSLHRLFRDRLKSLWCEWQLDLIHSQQGSVLWNQSVLRFCQNSHKHVNIQRMERN